MEKYGTYEIWECKRCGVLQHRLPGGELDTNCCGETLTNKTASNFDYPFQRRTDLEEKEANHEQHS